MTPFLPIRTTYDPRRLENTQLINDDKIYVEILWVKFAETTTFIINNLHDVMILLYSKFISLIPISRRYSESSP